MRGMISKERDEPEELLLVFLFLIPMDGGVLLFIVPLNDQQI